MKYKLTDETMEYYGRTLHRIQALKDFGLVEAGDLGGWIQSEKNLSQEGNCWVFHRAKVFQFARVYGNAEVFGDAEVFGNARVFDDAWVYGEAKVFGNAKVFDSAQVYDDAEIKNGSIG